MSFLSKLIERVVVSQMNDYCHSNHLNEVLQSAYIRGHSTETALLKVTNDVLCAMDNQQVTILTLLDLSAAFDTIPHDRFLMRIEHEFGIRGPALEWFRSYLSDRVQQVRINKSLSRQEPQETGMVQGSGICPWGYTKYMKPLGSLIRLLAILFHMFADDTQLYKTF